MAKSVMVIDDSATMRKIIMRTMRMAGLGIERVEEAANGEEALEKLKTDPVDILLCDINMPEMDGRELVRIIRENDSYSDIKIVMVSTESSDEIIEALKADGADVYMTKPFTPEKLQDELAPLMN